MTFVLITDMADTQTKEAKSTAVKKLLEAADEETDANKRRKVEGPLSVNVAERLRRTSPSNQHLVPVASQTCSRE